MAEPNEKPKPGERVYVPQKPPVVNPTTAPTPQGKPESIPQQTPSSGSDGSTSSTSDLLQEAMVAQRPPVMGSMTEIDPANHLIEPAGTEGRTIRMIAGETFVPQKPPVLQPKASQTNATEPVAPKQAVSKPAPEAGKSK